MRPQARDEPQHGRLSTARRSENGDELAFVGQVGHTERHIADDGQLAESLRDAVKLDDVRTGNGRSRWIVHAQSSTTRYGNRPRWNQNSRRSIPYASVPMMRRIRMMCSDKPRR